MEKDLLDLCHLNLMEESAKNAPEKDADEMQKVIDWKKRQLVSRLKRKLADG